MTGNTRNTLEGGRLPPGSGSCNTLSGIECSSTVSRAREPCRLLKIQTAIVATDGARKNIIPMLVETVDIFYRPQPSPQLQPGTGYRKRYKFITKSYEVVPPQGLFPGCS